MRAVNYPKTMVTSGMVTSPTQEKKNWISECSFNKKQETKQSSKFKELLTIFKVVCGRFHTQLNRKEKGDTHNTE